jgi:hypothetical protein
LAELESALKRKTRGHDWSTQGGGHHLISNCRNIWEDRPITSFQLMISKERRRRGSIIKTHSSIVTDYLDAGRSVWTVEAIILRNFWSLFCDAFSETGLYSIDGRVTSEWW